MFKYLENYIRIAGIMAHDYTCKHINNFGYFEEYICFCDKSVRSPEMTNTFEFGGIKITKSKALGGDVHFNFSGSGNPGLGFHSRGGTIEELIKFLSTPYQEPVNPKAAQIKALKETIEKAQLSIAEAQRQIDELSK